MDVYNELNEKCKEERISISLLIISSFQNTTRVRYIEKIASDSRKTAEKSNSNTVTSAGTRPEVDARLVVSASS